MNTGMISTRESFYLFCKMSVETKTICMMNDFVHLNMNNIPLHITLFSADPAFCFLPFRLFEYALVALIVTLTLVVTFAYDSIGETCVN